MREPEPPKVCTKKLRFLFEQEPLEALLPHRANNRDVLALIALAQTTPIDAGQGSQVFAFSDKTCSPLFSEVNEGDVVSWHAEKDLFWITPRKTSLDTFRLYGEAGGLTESALANLLTDWRRLKSPARGILCSGPDGKARIVDLAKVDNIRFE